MAEDMAKLRATYQALRRLEADQAGKPEGENAGKRADAMLEEYGAEMLDRCKRCGRHTVEDTNAHGFQVDGRTFCRCDDPIQPQRYAGHGRGTAFVSDETMRQVWGQWRAATKAYRADPNPEHPVAPKARVVVGVLDVLLSTFIEGMDRKGRR